MDGTEGHLMKQRMERKRRSADGNSHARTHARPDEGRAAASHLSVTEIDIAVIALRPKGL